MHTIYEKAPAKLNISLDVTERRQDGYHNMVMVMQTVSLCDDLTISFNDSGRVQAQSSMTFIPGDERNLAVRAALKFLEASGNTGQGMLITLNKHIPGRSPASIARTSPAVSGWARSGVWSSFLKSSGVEMENSGLQITKRQFGISGRTESASPRPFASAVPPATQNGTSEPTSPASVSSSGSVSGLP